MRPQASNNQPSQHQGAGERRAAVLAPLLADLWQRDQELLAFHPPTDYALDVQAGKAVHGHHDAAPDPLFRHVDKDKFFATPVFAAFYHLLDNYVAETGVREVATQEERQEEWRFVRLVAASALGDMAREAVVRLGWWRESATSPPPRQPSTTSSSAARLDLTPAQEAFATLLHQIWFTLYRRETHGDSSAFEHVFVGGMLHILFFFVFFFVFECAMTMSKLCIAFVCLGGRCRNPR
jgi:poly(U)-specific endoribonuclease